MKHILFISLVAVTLFSCSHADHGHDHADSNSENTTQSAPKPEPPAAAPVLSDEVLAQLAKADALDGTEDKVVGKCASCALLMDGKAEHSVAMGDYKLNMCSEPCAKNYGVDGETKLLALEIASE